MPWTAKIVNVDVRYESVTVDVEFANDAPPVNFTKTYNFSNDADLTKVNIIEMVKREVARVGGLYTNAEILKAEIGKAVNLKA